MSDIDKQTQFHGDLRYLAQRRQLFVLILCLLSVVAWESVAVGDLLNTPKGGHCTDFADEASDKMENAARSRGLTPNANALNMAIPRKKILEKIAGKQKGLDYHLDDHIPELIGKADKGLVEYWRKEVHRLIDEMEGWGGRLSKNDDVMSQAAKYRERLEDILNKRLRDLED